MKKSDIVILTGEGDSGYYSLPGICKLATKKTGKQPQGFAESSHCEGRKGGKAPSKKIKRRIERNQHPAPFMQQRKKKSRCSRIAGPIS